MASHDDLMSIIKTLVESMDKFGSSFSLVKSVSDRLTAVEENMGTSEDVRKVGDRLTDIEQKLALLCTSEEVKNIADKLTNLEQKVSLLSTSEEVINTGDRQTGLEDTMRTSEEVKVISEKLTNLEHQVPTSEEVEIIENLLSRTEENMSFDHQTGSSINTETTVKPLHFHSELKGRKVKLTNDLRTAERTDPLEDAVYGSVLSQRILRDDEIFTFRIEETIDKWTDWGISFGVIEEPRTEVKASDNICGNDDNNGTCAIHSSPNTTSGTSDTYRNGSPMTKNSYPMNTNYLSVGTVLGVSRRENGDLHFYLNGVDKGVAFIEVSEETYAFVDVVNYVTKISVVD